MNLKKRYYTQFFTVLFLGILTVNGYGQTQNAELSSPNGEIKIYFSTAGKGEIESGQLSYQVKYYDKKFITPSRLNLNLKGKEPLGKNVAITNITKSMDNQESYKLITGKTSSVDESYNQIAIELEEKKAPQRRYKISARAYNGGVAFKYEIPKQSSISQIELFDERTQFRFSTDAISYALELPNYQSMYESEFIKLPASAFANQGGISSNITIGLPLVLEIPGVGWASIIDTDLQGYASTYITNPTGSWTGHMFETRLSPQLDNEDIAVSSNTFPFQTSWKTIMIADHPGEFIESNMVTNLNPDIKIKDASWIESGKATWDWWSGSLDSNGEKAFTTENMKRYVDFAAQSGFRYMLIDAGWSDDDLTEPNGSVDVPEVAEYAQKQGVKVWVWAYYGAVKEQMTEAFPLFEKWGIAGVKIDFIERDDQEGIAFYYKTAKEAAEHHLMLDFHGSTKPTGIQRTWPNVLGYEAVVGMEQSKAGRRDNPEYHTMLPFTRGLVGLVDYTPGGFDNTTREGFEPRMQNPRVMGTRAHHLAMYVTIDSPLQMVSDHPSAYKGEEAFEFIKSVPTSWDQTKFINGEPGKYVTIAKKKGDKWFLGSITNWTSRTFDLDLSFLDKGRKYKAIIYADHPNSDKNPKRTTITDKIVSSETTLTIDLVSGGGCAIEFLPQ